MFFQLLICIFSWLTFASAAPLQTKSGCQSTCGDVSIPYPFGIGVGCYQNSGLALECNKSFTPPRLLLGTIVVRNISLSGTMTIAVWVSFDCYNKDGTSSDKFSQKMTLSKLFTFSHTRNKFTAVGCDTGAFMSDKDPKASQYFYQSGCVSLCADIEDVDERSCSAKAGCLYRCGNVRIPYPFGVGEPHCYQQSGLELVCNESYNPPKLLYGNMPVVDISLINRTMTVGLRVSYHCYDKFGASTNFAEWETTLSSLFTFSDTRNKFTVIGCDTNAVMSDSSVAISESGCMSVCPNEDSIVEGSCSGTGCCQTAIPKGLKTLNGYDDLGDKDGIYCALRVKQNKLLTLQLALEHLHGENLISSISWEDRLRICKEIAGALAYLHSSLCTPIFHRDIKARNILLDENFKAKVSDFGISRSVPYEQTHLSTLVQGTFGYLDPEYFRSGQFTEKSDVYGFGVVLVELLTGQKPISNTRSEEEANLVMHFISSVKEDRVLEILETRIANEARTEEIQIVASLAKKCLKLVGRKRPTMTQVLIQLENLRVFQHQESLRLLTEK
ncbi:hypothetical protein GIB67_033784 [Kingdonia uniflora]|uniref:Protein kinase domain-containing protein n=1 Tax=Kingdonia uniflora TaxID=39325 RepID=A0A7J7P4Q4_9MAGN|nr:hypothetical protein GIB67_033784 [Kingdonia uniflora]